MWPDDDLRIDLDLEVDGSIESYAQRFRSRWGLDANEPPEDLEWEQWYELLSLDAAARQLANAALNMYRAGSVTRREVNLPEQLAAAARSERAAAERFLADMKALGKEDQDWSAVETYVRKLIPDPEEFKYRFFRVALQVHFAYDTRILPSIYDVTDRLITLVNYLSREANPRTRDCLKRVARCYSFDMVPELCVMACHFPRA